MLKLKKTIILVALILISMPALSSSFRIELHDGKFYGPGSFGVTDIVGGSLENFVVSSPMTGLVPFVNNGGALPNVDAESAHTGPIDGLLSDGTKINENVNAAFVLEVPEPETKQPVKLFVGSVSEEIVKPDADDNLTFNLHAAFDTGFAQDLLRLPVQFNTGAVRVPLSEKNKRGLPGGSDMAGPLVSGTDCVGSLGDMDQDGFLDGVFVLAGNTPFELLIAEGDPVLIVRPFRSDIPISPREASYYELNGLIKNYWPVIATVIRSGDKALLASYFRDVDARIKAGVENFNRVRSKRGEVAEAAAWSKELPGQLSNVSKIISELLVSTENGSIDIKEKKLNDIFQDIDHVYKRVKVLQGKS